MDFEQYLSSKRIDAQKFSSTDEERFLSWKKDFEVMNPESFTHQKKFLINGIRRTYLLETIEEVASEVKKAAPKPVIKPKAAGVSSSPKPIIKPAIKGASPKPIVKPKLPTSEDTPKANPIPKPVMKPKIPTANKGEDKPVLKPVMKPLIKKTTEEEAKPKTSALKPKIPGKKS